MFKNTKRTVMGLSLALLMGIGVIGVNAEGALTPTTDINVKVTEQEIEKPTDPGDGNGGEGNPEAKGKLAIYFKPKAMLFEGKHHVTKAYTLKMNDATEKKRRITVADVRANQQGWDLKAKVSELKNADGSLKISDGYDVKMDTKLGMFEMDENQKPIISTVKDDANGVKVAGDKTFVTITTDDKAILSAKSEANSLAGKGYSVADFSNIEMNFAAGKGLAGEFTGTIDWTLENTAK